MHYNVFHVLQHARHLTIVQVIPALLKYFTENEKQTKYILNFILNYTTIQMFLISKIFFFIF